MTKPLPPSETVAEAFTLLARRTGTPLILLCDHARNALPDCYGTLGLGAAELARHIAYDIGAESITRGLAAALGAPAVLSNFSRLLIDLNRGLDDPTLIMRLSDGAIVPGNRHLDAAERRRRIDTYYRPYHAAIATEVDRAEAEGLRPQLVSIHSFTPIFQGHIRPWHASVLWGNDPRLAKPLLKALKAEPGLVIGENEPYAGVLEGDTLYKHGESRGHPHVLIEIRQDLIDAPAGQIEWAKRLARILEAIVPANPEHAEAYMTTPLPVPGASQTELEAAAFRRLLAHLRQRTDTQNIDLMNLAGFCRNCLANWLVDAAQERSLPLSKDQAREYVYQMPYEEWRARHQIESSEEQKARFAAASKPHDH